jgi:type II secretory pathway pseudopilin PulG
MTATAELPAFAYKETGCGVSSPRTRNNGTASSSVRGEDTPHANCCKAHVAVHSARSGSRAFSLIEVVLSGVVVSVMLVGTLEAVSSSLRTQAAILERAQGLFLAQDLMAEILQQPYKDATQTPVFGPETGDVDAAHPAVRSGLDDIDDYNNWADSPPHSRDGTAINGFDANWSRTVAVAWVSPDTGNTSGSETGVKRITITVKHNNKTIITLTAIATDSWQYPPYE